MVINVRNITFALLFTTFGALYSCSVGDIGPQRAPAQSASCAGQVGKLIDQFQEQVTFKKARELTRPGQLTYGRPKVDYLRSKIQDWEFEEIQEYIDARPIPYVRNPEGKWVIHDRHHFLLAFFKEIDDLNDRFPGKSLKFTYQKSADFKGKSWNKYQEFMVKNNYVNLRFKGQPVDWDELPQDLLDLKKDYFRGMAWVLIKADIIKKDGVPFFEFQWADFMRSRFPKLPPKWRLEHVETVMKDILENPEEYKSMPGLDHQLPTLDESLDQIEKISTALAW